MQPFFLYLMKITLDNCTIKLGKRTLLKDINFSLKQGDFFHLTGMNGSGKTVFLESLLGFHRISQGNRIISFKGKDICYIPDTHFFSEQETVLEVLLSFQYFYNTSYNTIYNILNKLNFDSSVKNTQKISSLSKGTKQKLAIVPLFIEGMKLYLLDEILDGLDKTSLKIVLEQLVSLQSQSAIIFTEHNPDIITKLNQLIPTMKEILCENQTVTLK